MLPWRAWGTSGDARKREKQLAETLLHLSHELQSCPSHGHTVTLLGMLAGGRGPIPAPSAIAGVVSRVGSLERSVEFHEDAILELERQGSVVDSLVAKFEEMDQLLAQLEQLSNLVAEVERDTAVRFEQTESLVNHVDELARRGQAGVLEGQLKQLTDTMEVQMHEHLSEFKGTSLAVAELGEKLEMRGRDVGELTSFVMQDTQVAGRLHEDLKQVMNLVEWSTGITTTLNYVDSRVDNLEQWGEELPPGQGGKNTGRLSVVGVPVNMQHMFQQSLVLSVHQQSGGHSSCMQILVRTVHTVQQTVDFHRCSFWLVVDAPVVVQ